MKNGVIMQYFEWNLPSDGMLWRRLRDDALHLHEIGISAVQIPPAYKGYKQTNEGCGTYNLYDLGGSDQKGTIHTKYGTKQELQEMIEEFHRNQIGVYLDVVTNRKAGVDYTEWFVAQEVDPRQQGNAASEPHEIEGWAGFDFSGCGNMHSSSKWHWFHFPEMDYDVPCKKDDIFQTLGEGKHRSEGVGDESGDHDYLMFADLDSDNPEVVCEMQDWGVRILNELDSDGMCPDAIKHMNDQFIEHFLEVVRADQGEDFYAAGEYWKDDTESLKAYLS